VKDLYTENHNTLKKKLNLTNKWKDFLCSWVERIDIVKVATLPKAIDRFTGIPIHFLIPAAFFGIRSILKIYGDTEDTK